MKTLLAVFTLLLAGALPAAAQVAISPTTTTPAAWERFALRVINQTDTPTVAVRIEVPAAVMVLGVEPVTGWTFETAQSPDSGPTTITWRGGMVKKGEYGEFPFLGRLKADARREVIVMPVQIERQNGSVVEWRRRANEPYPAPRVDVAGTVRVSASGALMMGALAMGVAILALILTIASNARKPGRS
jgi:uncharacterized protein YcnI